VLLSPSFLVDVFRGIWKLNLTDRKEGQEGISLLGSS